MAAQKKKITHGEDCLANIAAIEIHLENGEYVSFSMDEELRIPTDPLEVLKEARKAPARLAFFAYQAERQLSNVRKLEIDVAEEEGFCDLVTRKWYDEHTSEEYTETMVRSRVAIDKKIKSSKMTLNSARMRYSILRALRDSLEHRLYVLRKIVGQESDAYRV